MDRPYTRYDRYQRQIILEGLGMEGQQKLEQASVLVIGAGGLGCPALTYLAAAGIGRIGIADDDLVSLTNLHRQVLYNETDLGKPKAEVAATALQKLNAGIEVIPINKRVTNQHALEILDGFDIVIDGTDNFTSRYLINDACLLLNKPLVYGSIYRFEGQVAVFNVNGSSSYRDLFPSPPAGKIPSCDEAGVLGVLTGLIGTMQAAEAIKLITGIGKPLINRLLIYRMQDNQFYEITVRKNSESTGLFPENSESYKEWNYDSECGTIEQPVAEIDFDQFESMSSEEQVTVLDVREEYEQPKIDSLNAVNIPLGSLEKVAGEYRNRTIIIFCQTGKRSAEAARLLMNGQNKVYSLRGGILGWPQHFTKEVIR